MRIKSQIKELNRRKKLIENELKKIEIAIDALQDLCQHKFEQSGIGHSDMDFPVCIVCGKIDCWGDGR